MIVSCALHVLTDTVLSFDYSLFHQILGVVFFQFTPAIFEIFVWNFSLVIFSSFPNISENFVKFCFVFWKLDHLACNIILVLRWWWNKSCKSENLLRAKYSYFHNHDNTQQYFKHRSGKLKKCYSQDLVKQTVDLPINAVWLLSLHPPGLCRGGDLLSPHTAAAFCSCSRSKTPAQIISKY